MPGVLADCGVEHMVCYRFMMSNGGKMPEERTESHKVMERSQWYGSLKDIRGIDGIVRKVMTC